MDLWVKEVENPILKPLDQWRNDLYGYWMVITDSQVINGVKMAIARYYGTDEDKILDLWSELGPTAEYRLNKRSNWLGGAFIAKTDS